MCEYVWVYLIARISSEGIMGMVTMWLQKQKTKRHMSSDSNLEDVLLLFWLISDAAVVCVSLGIDARNSFLWFIHLFFSHSQFDTNGDGQISTAELREAMKKLLGQQVRRCWERLSFSLELSINHDVDLVCLLHLCVVPEIYATYIHPLSHKLTFPGWTQRSGGHPTRHRPERRRACRLWRWRILCNMGWHTLQFTQQNTFDCVQSLEIKHAYTTPFSVGVFSSFCLPLKHTHISQYKQSQHVWLISQYHADSEVRGWRQ